MIVDRLLLIEIYKFYENWSTEAFGTKEPMSWAPISTELCLYRIKGRAKVEYLPKIRAFPILNEKRIRT
jgi:hypothetical protein